MKMIRKGVFCLLLFISFQLFAQKQVNREFSGKVKLLTNKDCVDAPLDIGIFLATISFYDAETGASVDGTVTDEEGYFTYLYYNCDNCIAVVEFFEGMHEDIKFERKAFLMKDEYLDTHFEIELIRRCP